MPGVPSSNNLDPSKFSQQQTLGEPNNFRLTGGETIKIGRVKFRVREVVTVKADSSSEGNKTDINSFLESGAP